MADPTDAPDAAEVAAVAPGPAGVVRVRPYRASDRDGVRRVCVATGFLGDPVGWLYRDEASFADLFCGWYVDHEPEHVWVVDDGSGQVAGYLLGAIDSRRVASPARQLAPHLLRRAVLLRPGTGRFWWRAAIDAVRVRGRVQVPVDLTRWPAHLHIDLLPSVRNQGFGHQLMGRWLDVLDAASVPGVHLTTFVENAPAQAFFASCGFVRRGPTVVAPGFRTPSGARLHGCALTLDLPRGRRPGPGRSG